MLLQSCGSGFRGATLESASAMTFSLYLGGTLCVHHIEPVQGVVPAVLA